MIRHILIVAWRNICKYKVSAGIAVVGLAMGLLCFVLCNFCARLFFSIDKVFPNYDRMAEIQIKVGEGGELQDYFAGTPPTLAGDMETAFPGQIECCTAVSYGGQMNVTFERGEKKPLVCMLYTIEVDSNFQKVFSVQLTDGNWRQLFRQKNAVVLSRSAACRIFGKQNPVGKVFHPNKLTRRSERNYTPEELAAIDYVVSGVMEDLPVNASYSLLNRIDALLINDQQGRFAGYVPGEGTGCTTFALLYPGVKKETVNQRIDPEKNKIFVSGMEGRPQLLSPGKNSTEYYHDLGYGYLCIGLLILLVAVLNFFIFISGNFLNRQKEYNIRRAIGSSCRQVLGLLFAETMIMLMAVGIIVACLLELLYDRLDFSLTRQVIVFEPAMLYRHLLQYLGGCVVLFLGVCWGISHRLNRQSIQTGIGTSLKIRKNRLRNWMLGMQLVICFLFFTGGLAVYLQSEMNMKNIFPFLDKQEREHILEVNLTYPQLQGLETAYIARFGEIAGVTDVLPMDKDLFGGYFSTTTVRLGEGKYREFCEVRTGPNFASFFHIPVLAGEMFKYPGQRVADRIIDGIYGGKVITDGFEDIDGKKINICGVVEAIPQIYAESHTWARLWMLSEHPRWCYLKVLPGSKAKVMETVQRMLAEEVPESLDNRIFTLEELVQKENHSQEQMKSMLLFFTLVCLSITVLGIYSAISIDTERRRKEIAIRKINGASAYVIVRLFARLYLRLLVAAMVLTFPFLNWIMHLWLQGFTLHFGHGPAFWIFIVFVMVTVVALTIAWKIRAIIRVNPVEALRDE